MSREQRALIVYGSSYGQTAKVAERIRQRLAERGFEAEVHRGDRLPADLDPGAYAVVAVGASLVAGGYQRYVARFVKRNRDALSRTRSAFFAVSGSAGSENAEEREEARRIMRRFLERLGWRPAATASFAGAIAFTRYNPLVRWMMKRIARKEGVSTDTSRDHEYTDWDQVDAFAGALAALAS